MYGDVVRRARQTRGLTQADLAETTGIEQANISAIERGRRLPSAATLHQLLLACGYELVATAGERTIAFPASPDDQPGDVPDEPALAVPMRTRARMVVAALSAAEATIRRT